MFINLNPIDAPGYSPPVTAPAPSEGVGTPSFRQALAQEIQPPALERIELHPGWYVEIYSPLLEGELAVPEDAETEPLEHPPEETEQEDSAQGSASDENTQTGNPSGEEGGLAESGFAEPNTDWGISESVIENSAGDIPFEVALHQLPGEHEHLEWRDSESHVTPWIRWLNSEDEDTNQSLSLAEARFLLGCLLKQTPAVSSHLESTMLGALMHQRKIDQDRLLCLNPTEWEMVFQLLPQRFFTGLASPLWQALKREPTTVNEWHECFQKISAQEPLPQVQSRSLAALYSNGIGEPNRLLEAWVTGEKGIYNHHGMMRLLPLLQVQHAYLPGVLGHIQRLMLPVQDNTQQLSWLFRLVQTLMQGRFLPVSQVERYATFLAHWLSLEAVSRPLLKGEYQRLLSAQQPHLENWQVLNQQQGVHWLHYIPLHQVAPVVKQTLWVLHTIPEPTPSTVLQVLGQGLLA